MLNRFTIAAMLAIAAAGSAFALVPSAAPTANSHETVIMKNQAFPTVGPLLIEPCANETCSEVDS